MKKLWFSNLALVLGCLSTATAFGQYPGAYGSLAPSAYPVQYPHPGQMPATWAQMNGAANPMMGNQVMGNQVMGSSIPTYPAPTPSFTQMNPSNPLGAMQAQTYSQAAMMQQQAMSGQLQPGWFGQRNATFQLAGAQENVPAQPLPPPLALPSPLVPAPVPMQVGPQASMNGVPQSIIEDGSSMQNSMNLSVQNQGQTLPYQAAPNSMMMNPAYGQSIAPGCTSCGAAPLAESYGYPMSLPQSYGPQYSAPQMGRIGHFGRGACSFAMPPCSKPYFGGGSMLLFFRVDDDNAALTYDVNNPSENALGTHDASTGLIPGFEIFLGRYFNCGRNALAISYWGLFPEEQMATVTTSGGADLRSRYHFNNVDMPAFGTYAQDTVYNWYDLAQAHRIDRSSNYNNVEANLLGFAIGGAARSFYLPTGGKMFSRSHGGHGCGYCGGAGCGMCGAQAGCGDSCGSGCGDCNSCRPIRFATGPCCLTPGCCSRMNFTWLAGLRYFRFEDNLAYAASRADNLFGYGNDDIYYNSNVTNDLFGGQIGGILNYCCGRRCSLYAASKMGLYGNHAQFDSSLGTYTQDAYVSSGPNSGDSYMVSASKTDIAFIGELGTGINYRLTSKWSGNVGYRAIFASGVATAVDQLPLQMSHLGNVANFDNNASLILHGINLGAQYNY